MEGGGWRVAEWRIRATKQNEQTKEKERYSQNSDSRDSITVPGPWIDVLCGCAKENDVVVVIGVNEIDPILTGTIYNTNLIIDNHGNLLGKHRKLVPTYPCGH